MSTTIQIADKPTLDSVSTKVGDTNDTGGSSTAGTIMGKLNKIIGDGQNNTKNNPNLVLSSYYVVLNANNNFESEITWSRIGDAAISAEVFDETIAKIKVSGNKISATGNLPGETSIRVTLGESDSYTSCTKVIRIVTQYPSSNLAECTPAEIQAMAKSGLAPNCWSVGDVVPIAINGTVGTLDINGTYYAFILGFNHNSGIEGNNTIHFQFGKTSDGKDIAFVDSNYGKTASSGFVIKSNKAYCLKWSESDMRKTICPKFLAALPQEWQDIIVDCTKISTYMSNTSEVSATEEVVDKIWLLSRTEIFGTGASGKQYDYYANGNPTTKYKHSDISTVAYWWTRDASTGGNGGLWSNNSGTNHTNYSYGFAPGFVVA